MENEIYSDIKSRMIKTVEHYAHEVAIIRTGRASVDILDTVKVDYYGTLSPLNNIAHVSIPEPQSILIQPFDPTSLEAIEKAITASDLGLSPNNDGNLIRLNIPALTEERRKDLVKQVKSEIENSKISVRNARQKANDEIKKLGKKGLSEDIVRDSEVSVQTLTNKYITIIDKYFEDKQKDVMTI